MKKNYRQPNTIIVKVKMQSMIAASPVATLDMGGTTQTTGELLSRERGWDNEGDDW